MTPESLETGSFGSPSPASAFQRPLGLVARGLRAFFSRASGSSAQPAPVVPPMEPNDEETRYVLSFPGAAEAIAEGVDTPTSQLHTIHLTDQYLGL